LQGDPLKAPAQLTWKVVADGKGYALEAHNPTPYYVTVTAATLNTTTADTGMVAPLSDLRMPLHDTAQKPAAGTIHFTAINDYGAAADFTGAVAP
jgi:chaperone protein EcpD